MTHTMVFCEICNIGVSSEMTMRDHVKGRRHQQALTAAERRKSLAKTSLYCHGFPPSVPEPALRSYFHQFGTVTRMILETHRGCYCIVQYDSEAPVQLALSKQFHQLNGITLTVRPRKPITPYRRPTDNDYRPSRSASPANSTKEDDEHSEATHDQLMKTLLEADSVLAQMETLFESMRLSVTDLQRRKEVCSYVQSLLQPYLPTCTIHQFGSSVNGFGLKGCDMDIFLDLHDAEVSLQREEAIRHKIKPITLPYIRELVSLKTTEGPLLPSQLRTLPLVHRVKLVSRILMQHAHLCTDVQFVPSQRCPIVRFIHGPTGVKCDLSVNNRLALRNTQLLQLCAEDPRVRLVVFVVRYWGKWKHVAGNQSCGPRLSNYCLSMLVIFYLMNTHPPVLPSVQAMADTTNQKCIIEDWDCTLPKTLPPSVNKQTADELLAGFFQLLSQIALSSSVLMVRTGGSVSLNDFLLEKMTSPVLADFKIKALAIQDPFVLHHNIAQNVNAGLRDSLLQELANAAAKTASWLPDKVMAAKASGRCWGLPYLFSSESPQVAPVSSSTTVASTPSPWCKTWPPKVQRPAQFTFSLTLDLATMPKELLLTLRSQGDYRVAWFQHVRRLLVWALREVFLFDLHSDQGKGSLILDDEDDEETEEETEKREEEMCVEGGGAAGGGSATPEDNSAVSGAATLPLDVGEQTAAPAQLCGSDAINSMPVHRDTSGDIGKCVMPVESPLPIAPRLSNSGSPSKGRNRGEGEGAVVYANCSASPIVRASPGCSNSCQAGALYGEAREITLEEFASILPQRLSGMDSATEESVQSLNTFRNRKSLCVEQSLPACSAKMSPKGKTLTSALSPVTASNLIPSSPSVTSGKGVVRYKCNSSPRAETCVSASEDVEMAECSKTSDSACLPPSLPHPPSCVQPDLDCGAKTSNAKKRKVGKSDTPVKIGNLQADDSSLSHSAVPSTGRSCTKVKKCGILRFRCTGRHKAWQGRKVIRSVLLSEGHEDGPQLECLISQRIASSENPTSGSKQAALSFRCSLVPVPTADRAEAEVWLEPEKPLQKDFSVFMTFFRSFFTKLVSRHLLLSNLCLHPAGQDNSVHA